MTNVTGWNELFNGSIFAAGVAVYQAALGDWFLTLLFFAIKVMLYMSNKSMALHLTLSLFFASLFILNMDPMVQTLIGSVIVIEMTMLVYSVLNKK